MNHLRKRYALKAPAIVLACAALILIGRWTFGSGTDSPRERSQVRSAVPRIRTLGRATLPAPSGRRFAEDRVLVKFRPGLAARSVRPLLEAYGSATIASVPGVALRVVAVPKGVTATEFLSALNRNPDVAVARPDPITRIAVRPNDKYFGDQYALSNSGQVLDDLPESPQGKAGADINATGGWDQTKGDSGVIIAVLDTGVELTHPDIKNKIVSPGKDFVNGDNDASDDLWHGTHVAGIAAAETNNELGIAGVAWDCAVLPGKIIDASGEGDYGALILAIYWAVDQGAKVINLSLGGEERDDDLLAALKDAYERNVVIVAAAGNEGGPVLYPAAYDRYCLAVAATDYNDNRADFSNMGPEIDVAAPGIDVLSLYPTWDTPAGFAPYAYANGTSMATPHVAGLAALLKSLKPWLTAGEVMNIIRYSADDVNADGFPGRDDQIGFGRINAERALAPYALKPVK
jgi:subtilisin family serine protease